MGGPDAASEHLKQIRWHLDLSRRTDGSFAYDGKEQYGAGTTSGNTYLGAADYDGMSSNAMYLLTYSLPLQRLWITGKTANPAYTLNSTKIAAAVSAGSFRLDRGTKSIAQLFTAIGDYDPLVRHYASIELASRTLSGTDLTNLRNLLSSADSNFRQGACETLGILQDSTALPTIVTLLNDSDNWVRAKAAIAIRAFSPAAVSVHRDAMMTSFIANATDPNVIENPSKDAAATELAGYALKMLDPKNSGRILDELAEKIREQQNPKPGSIVKPNRTFEVTRAMITFIHRERRIPGKTELHMEANRRHESVRMAQERESHKIGEVVGKGRTRFRIYMFDRIPGFAYLCPFGQWDNLRWNETHYSKVILREAGMHGLPHRKLGGHQKKELRTPT
jgi:hypothetical protein